MIHYVSMSTNVIKSIEASLFQVELYHDVHSFVSKYLEASIIFI